jgi:CheY-like chemotaxis protein
MNKESRHKTEEIPVQSDPGPVRILFMDDEELVRDAVQRLLEANGYDVEMAVSGEEAIEKYRIASKDGNAFDIVIMDLTVSQGMGAKEAVGALLELDPAAKVIVTSGYSVDPVLAKYREFGFTGVLVKPFTSAELKESITDALAG